MPGQKILMIIRPYLSRAIFLEGRDAHLCPSAAQFSIKINHLASKANFESFVRW